MTAIHLINANEGIFAENLCKSYGKRPVLRGVNLHLRRGEIVGLLGPNGAGKTTCFGLIMGMVFPDEGRVCLDSYDITHQPMYQRARFGIGYLPQETSIFRGLTVEKNILAVLELIETSERKQQEQLDQLLDEFGLSHLRQTPAIALSGGERRRVEIARALAISPHFLLLDEPLAGIDPIAMGDIRHLILHLKSRGIGILITDHNVRETLDVVDRAYIITNGLVLMEGTPQEIIEHQDVRRVYLGERFTL